VLAQRAAKHLLGYLRPKAEARVKAKTKLIYVAGRQMAEGPGNKQSNLKWQQLNANHGGYHCRANVSSGYLGSWILGYPTTDTDTTWLGWQSNAFILHIIQMIICVQSSAFVAAFAFAVVVGVKESPSRNVNLCSSVR